MAQIKRSKHETIKKCLKTAGKRIVKTCILQNIKNQPVVSFATGAVCYAALAKQKGSGQVVTHLLAVACGIMTKQSTG